MSDPFLLVSAIALGLVVAVIWLWLELHDARSTLNRLTVAVALGLGCRPADWPPEMPEPPGGPSPLDFGEARNAWRRSQAEVNMLLPTRGGDGR